MEVTDPKLPIGSRYSKPNQTFHSKNKSDFIDSQEYSGHALDEMRTQGIMPSVVKDALKNGNKMVGKKLGRSVFYKPDNNVSVVVDNQTSRIITVSIGKLRPGVK